jgi:uncharacterized membrane protein YhaH (DUF805 family)
MNFFSILFSLSGNVSRREYWFSLILVFIVFSIALDLCKEYLSEYEANLENILVIIILFYYVLIQIKRCRDIGWHPGFVVLSFIPYVFVIWLITIGTIESWKKIATKLDREIESWKKIATKLDREIENSREKKAIEVARDREIEKNKDYKKPINDNFSKYLQYTKEQNWEGICRFNDVNFDGFGTRKELNALPDYLADDEVVFAFASGLIKQSQTSNSFDFGLNTWLVILTNERFLFLDSAMLTNSIDTQSIRHERVQAVSSSQGLVLGKIMIDIGNRMITIDNCQKDAVSVIAYIANMWCKELQKQQFLQNNSATSAAGGALDKLEKLTELYSKGALTEEEFKAAKGKILNEI